MKMVVEVVIVVIIMLKHCLTQMNKLKEEMFCDKAPMLL
jgi:hypothetical protein